MEFKEIQKNQSRFGRNKKRIKQEDSYSSLSKLTILISRQCGADIKILIDTEINEIELIFQK